MSLPTDARVVAAGLWFLPVTTRLPLKFGAETVTALTVARVRITVEGTVGRAEGWGETPLSVTWVWPSSLSHDVRHAALRDFSRRLAAAWAAFPVAGHPLAVGHAFQQQQLRPLLAAFNAERAGAEPMPWLAALVCCSPYDLALHDAYGQLHRRPVYETYTAAYLERDLAAYLEPAEGCAVSFAGKFPADFLQTRRQLLPAWHLVGGRDPIDHGDLTGDEPDDGDPVLLADWIRRDGLKCLKIKLIGTNHGADYRRLVQVGRLAAEMGVSWLSADFNCLVDEPAYVTSILDRLLIEAPRLYGMLLYVEQPFPYELAAHRIDVHSVSARKPLFMDESAHDWEAVRLGRQLGWTGVALKTCKTQTGALLSLCWAKAHGMTVMVQDLTNPMLAQIPHVLLAAHAGTIMGVETNAMQFYPKASAPEATVHPGIYRRVDGTIDLSSLQGPGFGYRLAEIDRHLPEPACEA